ALSIFRPDGATTMTRHGCSRLASFAASIEVSTSDSRAMTTSVRTRPSAIAPPSSRRRTRRLFTAFVVVSGMSMIIAGSSPVGGSCRAGAHDGVGGCRAGAPRSARAAPRERSRAPPRAAVAREHRVGGLRSPRAGPVRLGRALRLPVRRDGVEDLPGELDLLAGGEQRRVAEEHVEDEPLVRLRGGLGGRGPGPEVQRDVADL